MVTTNVNKLSTMKKVTHKLGMKEDLAVCNPQRELFKEKIEKYLKRKAEKM